MEKQFVTCDIAIALKELGFDEECLAYYSPDDEFVLMYDPKIIKYAKKYHKEDESKLAPLWQQALDFFREKFEIEPLIERCCDIDDPSYIVYELTLISDIFEEDGPIDGVYESYYQARKAAIEKMIKLYKKD